MRSKPSCDPLALWADLMTATPIAAWARWWAGAVRVVAQGAGDRTPARGFGDRCSTTELHPRILVELWALEPPGGFEPPTICLQGRRSTGLSYGGTPKPALRGAGQRVAVVHRRLRIRAFYPYAGFCATLILDRLLRPPLLHRHIAPPAARVAARPAGADGEMIGCRPLLVVRIEAAGLRLHACRVDAPPGAAVSVCHADPHGWSGWHGGLLSRHQ